MKITLITVCYNSEKTIKDTLESVLMQTYENYEYLIIDGKSKDETVSILKEYEKKFKGKMKFVSEKDKGLYDAMNKGIDMSTGDIVGILNSDDVLIDKDVFKKIVDNYKEDTDVLYADLIYVDETLKTPIRDYISGYKSGDYWCPAHPTMYIRKKVFDEIGKYNLEYKTCADYDFMVRLNINNYKFTYLRDYLVLMRMGGVSNGIKGYYNNFKDAYSILKDNKVKFPLLKTFRRIIHIMFQYVNALGKQGKIKEIINNK
ncbi:MAG: glycosyltransferase [Erysipelotrichales bacterium]|nr:glycosyltransferase [Erysipelotrichales bacterium]